MEQENIRGAFEEVVEKQNSWLEKCGLVINQMNNELQLALSKLQSEQDPAVSVESILGGLQRGIELIKREKKWQTAQEEVESEHENCFNVLEEELDIDLSENKTIDFDVQTINHIIADHFFLQGMFEIGDCFIREAGIPVDDTLRAQFFEMHQILGALRAGDFQLAQNWITSNQNILREIGSRIEVRFHQARFVEILKQASMNDALGYFRANLTPLASYHQREVHRTMSWLLYMENPENCPDSQFARANWESFADELALQYCILLGRSWRAPLTVTTEAGEEALLAPSRWLKCLANIRTGRTIKIPLRSAVKLSDAFQFHSVFVCPSNHVEASNENPPMMLPCGHVYLHGFIKMMFEFHDGASLICPDCNDLFEINQCKRLYL